MRFEKARVLLLVCGLAMMALGSGWAQSSELPDAPGESKRESGDRGRPAPDKARGGAPGWALRARDWEAGWITGEYVDRNQKLVALTGKQRADIYLRQTLTTPGAYAKRMFGALIDQARGVPPEWQGGLGGYGERFASREGQFISANTLAALGNAKLGYEVRYDKCKCDGFWPRTRHAIARNFMTYDRSEEHRRPQWALYGGAFSRGLVATAWKPRSQNALMNAGWAVLGQAGYGALLNFVIEFSREINRKQGVK